MSSFASVKGPSTTVRLLPEHLTRQPFELGFRPEPSSSTPAFCSSSWYFCISEMSFSEGITPASLSFVALTIIMNRMLFSNQLGAGPPGGSGRMKGQALDCTTSEALRNRQIERTSLSRRSPGRRWSRKGLAISILESIAGPEDPRHDRERHREECTGHGEAHPHAHVGQAVEAPAESAHEVDHGVEERDRPPEGRKHVDGVEAAAEKGERRDDQERYGLELLETVSPDADDEADEAECHRGQHEEEDHPEGMLDPERHQQRRRREDDEAEDDRLGRGRPDITHRDLEIGDRCRQQLVNRPGELGKVDAEGGVGETLRQQRQHDEPRHDEGAVADVLDLGYASADRRAEDDEVQGRRNHRGDDALHQRASRARHLEFVDSAYCVHVYGVHFLSLTKVTKMSSSELCVVCRSLKRTPHPVRSLRSEAMALRSPFSS